MFNYLKWIVTMMSLLAICSCASSQLKIESTMGNFYKKINTKEFLKRGTFKLNVEASDKIISASLFKAPQIVQLSIDLSQIDRILYVKLLEKDLLNIDRHLLLGKEYLYLNQEGKLYVLIDLPVIYFFKGYVKFNLEILGLNSEGKFTKFERKKIVFNWNPLKKSNESGFIYGNLLSSKELKDQATILNVAKRELKNAAFHRFHPEYSRELMKFVTE